MTQKTEPDTVTEKEAERWFQYALESMKIAKEYGVFTIQSVILLNGGAIVAIIALLGNIEDNKVKLIVSGGFIDSALLAFSLGIFFAAAGAGFGYLNYTYVHMSYPSPYQLSQYVNNGSTEGWRKEYNISIGWTNICGVSSVIISILMLIIGSLLAKHGLMQAFQS